MKYRRFLWLLLLCPLLMGALLDDTKATEEQYLNLSSQDFGLYGPLSFGMQYSKEFGIYLQGKFTQLLNPYFATSLDIESGQKLRRFNATFGYLLSLKQRLKFSAEYLTQNLTFDFISGEVNKWVGQNAYGITYEYLLPYDFVKSIVFNVFYSKAQSENLSPIFYFDQNDQLYEDFRYIAGATDTHGSLQVNLLPIKNTLLGLQLNYDNLNYNKKYPCEDDSYNGFDFTINLQQLITKQLKLQLSASRVPAYQDYHAEIDWLIHSMSGTRFELGLNGERIIGNHGLQSDIRVGVNLNLRLGVNKTNSATHGYNLNLTDNFTDLSDWTAKPAVYMPQVLAVKNEYTMALGTEPFANPNAVVNDLYVTFGQNFSKSFKALYLFIDPMQKFNSLILKADGEGAVNLEYTFTSDPNQQDNGTLTIFGTPSKPTSNTKNKEADVTICAKNFKTPNGRWSSSTQQFKIHMLYDNPVIHIPEQSFHLYEEVNKDLTNYIDFGSEKLQQIKADSLNEYGLKINLNQNGDKVTLTGTAKKSASQEKIIITVKNSAGKISEGNFILNISDIVPTFTLTCPRPNSDFSYDHQWCETHPNSPVDYYGEKNGYKFELDTQFYGHIYCNDLPKPGEMKFIGAYISNTPMGSLLVCRYIFMAEKQWYTTQSIPPYSEFHYHSPSKNSCTPNSPTVEKCIVDLKS
ncbi:MAG: hypothetical protein AMJ43_05220 [Coxiella sp. DG_40]|nr:MAG: hypothetical protein AMJ43_05220 [Coxiella sp. DG_40]